MGTIFGAIFCVALFAVVIVSARMRKKALQKIYEQYQEKDFAYTLVIGGYDWGPGTEKMILNLGKVSENFTDKDLDVSNFSVTVKSEIFDKGQNKVVEQEKAVSIKKVYPCDIDGNILEKDSSSSDSDGMELEDFTHIALELEPRPDDPFTNPFLYDEIVEHNRWKKVYDFTIGHPKFEKPMTDCSDWFSPEINRFKQVKPCGQLTATSFVPENARDGKLHPLIVWLHGAGEGGKDPDLVVLGNKVSALGGEKIQSYFDGAFVLCPQAPTFWMQNGDRPYDILEESTVDKKSRYTKDCKRLIDRFVKKNPSIDRNRIYIAGCSNGGYMTMNMILSYPDFFAAAVPVAEAYQDRWMTNNDIKSIDRMPIWFVAAKDDETVPPEQHVVPTTRRLLESRVGYILHMNLFDSIQDDSGKYFDKDGSPYKYFSHWSWIPVFNDKCYDEDDESLWSWLSQQKKNKSK